MKKGISIFALTLISFLPEAKAQTKEIDGIVIRKNSDDLLESVIVLVKGTNQGMITGDDGHFDLQVNKGDTLEFTARGFKSTELVVGYGNLYKAELEVEKNRF